jgi:YtxH-like protein
MADLNAESILGALGLQRQGSSDTLAPVVGAFVVGGLIGAGLALLLAPKSGKELRRDLGQRVDEALESNEKVAMTSERPAKDEFNGGMSASPGTTPPARPSSF